MTLLGDALEAVYRSRWSFRTMRAVGVTEDETHRLWVVRPDRLRGEHDGRGGTSTIVRSGPLWWRWHQDHRGMFGDDREVGLVTFGALTHLVDPTPLLGAARLEALGENEVIGRRVIRLRAEPRTEDVVVEPGWHVTARGLEALGLDAASGADGARLVRRSPALGIEDFGISYSAAARLSHPRRQRLQVVEVELQRARR